MTKAKTSPGKTILVQVKAHCQWKIDSVCKNVSASETYLMLTIDSSWKPVAFKEWAVVCDAIASGEQSVILRKGGIAEGRSGFQWNHDRFLLFPTRFHQQGDLVRPTQNGDPRNPDPSENDSMIPFTLFVEIIAAGRLTDWNVICDLECYHIWRRECIRARFEWGDQPGISCAVIRVLKLTCPFILTNREAFGGCRSWINLPDDELNGKRL